MWYGRPTVVLVVFVFVVVVLEFSAKVVHVFVTYMAARIMKPDLLSNSVVRVTQDRAQTFGPF